MSLESESDDEDDDEDSQIIDDGDDTVAGDLDHFIEQLSQSEGSFDALVMVMALIRHDSTFASNCVKDNDVWEFKKQRTAALRYLHFALQTSLGFLSRPAELEHRTPALALNIRCATILPELRLDVLVQSRHQPVISNLAHAAVAVNELIQREDPLPRCWLYFNAQYRAITA